MISLILAQFLVASPVVAQDADQPNATEQAQPQAKEKTVCKAVRDTGSRLAKRKECRTETQWEAISEAAERNVERGGSSGRTGN